MKEFGISLEHDFIEQLIEKTRIGEEKGCCGGSVISV